jgi:hypothetical protein
MAQGRRSTIRQPSPVSLPPYAVDRNPEAEATPQAPPSSSTRELRSRGRVGSLTLPPFSGNSSLSTHLAKWRNCAAYHSWDSVARVCQLKGSLEGPEATLLWQLPESRTEEELLELLQARFGDETQVESYRAQLRSRRRKRGESLQSLYLDICRLLALTYPGDAGRYSGITARDAYIQALGTMKSAFVFSIVVRKHCRKRTKSR